MRVLHVVKTSDGAAWAAAQAAMLHKEGIEVHVALPSSQGAMLGAWHDSGAILHIQDLSIPASKPWRMTEIRRRAARLVEQVAPALIHSHFFSTTMLLRSALGSNSSVPLLFQVPGPLHLENALFRQWDLGTARANDYWIGSSRCIVDHYLRSGVSPASVFQSYYGFQPQLIATKRTQALRRKLGIAESQYVVGSICHFYAPKYYLGQRRGLKNHETLIETLAELIRRRSDVTGVLAGGPWQGAERYFERVKKMARQLGKGRILMPGALSSSETRLSWADYDCVIHTPTSENCGGVIEPLTAHVPVIAARVGGLPEVIVDGRTGVTVRANPGPKETADAVLGVLEDLPNQRGIAGNGARLVARMFDVERTALEISRIYRHVLDPRRHDAPLPFDSSAALNEMEYQHAVA
jgi:glycosyltransferase involved in cell wall biosynthesis